MWLHDTENSALWLTPYTDTFRCNIFYKWHAEKFFQHECGHKARNTPNILHWVNFCWKSWHQEEEGSISKDIFKVVLLTRLKGSIDIHACHPKGCYIFGHFIDVISIHFNNYESCPSTIDNDYYPWSFFFIKYFLKPFIYIFSIFHSPAFLWNFMWISWTFIYVSKPYTIWSTEGINI